MNILLVNLTRFGDQLQSQSAINALGSAGSVDGGRKNGVCLVCLPNFSGASKLLSNLSMVYPLPHDGFLAKLRQSWPLAVHELAEWRERLWESFKPDLVYNLTSSVSSRMLSRYLAAELSVHGFGLDEFGFGQTPPWAAFLQGSSAMRTISPFNIVDLFRAVAGKSVGSEDDYRLLEPLPEAVDGMRGRIGDMADESYGWKGTRPEYEGFIGFQLGASEERRRWPLEYFVSLGESVYREHRLIPVLFGSKDEEPLEQRYAERAAVPFVSLIGRTSLQELAAALCSVQCLVSNDTGTMHLAAGLGRKVVGFFLATAQAWDTGPYLEDCCSLEPGLACHPCAFGAACPNGLRCRQAIRPELVACLISKYLRTGRWQAYEEAPVFAASSFDAATERTRIWVSVKDKYGCMELSSISGHGRDARTIWFMEQRHFLRQFLDRTATGEFKPWAPPYPLELAAEEREKLAGELGRLEMQLTLLLEQGRMLALKPLPPLRERFLGTLRKVSVAFASSAYLASLKLLWDIDVQEQGSSLEGAIRCINQYSSLIEMLLQRVKLGV